MSKTLHVEVMSPEKTLFTGEVVAVSSLNEKGKFDVLEEHENFISLVKERIILHLANKTSTTYPIERGVIKVYSDTVLILIEMREGHPTESVPH